MAESIYYIETALRQRRILTEKEMEYVMQAKRKQDLDEQLNALKEQNIQVVFWGQREYPVRLQKIYDPPYAVYYRGNIPKETGCCIAIVGVYTMHAVWGKICPGIRKKTGRSRDFGSFGRRSDRTWPRGALLGNGHTFAVLGSGADVCYPREHMGLYQDILEQEEDNSELSLVLHRFRSIFQDETGSSVPCRMLCL